MTTSRKEGAAVPPGPDAFPTDSMSTDAHIRRFLTGETTGQVVLAALYDHVLDEPVPQRLKDLLPK